MEKIFKNTEFTEDDIIRTITTHILLSFDFYNGTNINVIPNNKEFSVIYNRQDIFRGEPHIIYTPNSIFNYKLVGLYRKVAQDEYRFLSYFVPQNQLHVGNWILAFLHELGHIYFWNMYINQKTLDEYESICDSTFFSLAAINDLSVYPKGNRDDLDDEYLYNIEMCYKNNLKESNAWNFAYTHFPRIWNMLKIRGLI